MDNYTDPLELLVHNLFRPAPLCYEATWRSDSAL